ncbi:hypothetical protein GLOIN_2v1523568 [Rhizophagus irregularis DAOM 181602=DAOM 197198]|uniref:Uncharacterized protein n=1 Tax=Rhizophagus irregularis (strain DAOM 181602 / DAOM 197198 / MUCL 43194) TaxID=747089 RepID=A0A2P4QQB7_RHIID|nr:hypothetical protein GLOIN_2v1523568 [Rhizophagus irregularis DAOM 181602=DAOM 197198]POG79841.1 hypothetical protein GLOIN_2v1523568 [Rhizophagus irregularis DAOM 181602=DAOM 197198]|eukprot:XP_025186707.1 hypothetical protein GLOIN_2v1523568 [Rhizophagus irregularis DAOM 181602=DAOM 197198]
MTNSRICRRITSKNINANWSWKRILIFEIGGSDGYYWIKVFKIRRKKLPKLKL